MIQARSSPHSVRQDRAKETTIMSRQEVLLRQVNRGRAINTTLGTFKMLVKTKCLLPTMHTTSFTNMMCKQVRVCTKKVKVNILMSSKSPSRYPGPLDTTNHIAQQGDGATRTTRVTTRGFQPPRFPNSTHCRILRQATATFQGCKTLIHLGVERVGQVRLNEEQQHCMRRTKPSAMIPDGHDYSTADTSTHFHQ